MKYMVSPDPEGISNLPLSDLSPLPPGESETGGIVQEKPVRLQHTDKRSGIALVGLGNYSTGQLAPALQATKHCYLAGIVTGTPAKAEQWKKKYAIPDRNIYNYGDFDSIKDNPDIDIVYVVLPNALHAEYVIRAAEAGKHVICEKPMAVTVEECNSMISACRNAGVRLSIGYRLHFEPHHREVMRLGTEKVYGTLAKLEAGHGMSETGGWRIDQQLAGGGPLVDVGIYCIQAVRYTTGLEPVAVTAKEITGASKKYKEVEDALSWQMEMPGGLIGECRASYVEEYNYLRAEAARGWFELEPAYAYSGIEGKTSGGPMDIDNVPQQALQMDDFALAILHNRPTPVPGEMGLQDVKIIEAIYRSMKTGRRVVL